MSDKYTNITIESGMTLCKMLGNGNSVEIPIIQRDYAQGRKNAKELRNDFLKDIFNHLKDNKKMKLSFVYGTTNGSIYIPYDGQQRLTLVYLLSLFLSAYCEDWDSIRNLSQFTYYTRDYATAFCRFLTEFDADFEDGKKNIFQRIDVHRKKSISDSIENDSSFFGTWKYEPTVSSMLVVLKSIQDEFLEITDKLTQDERNDKAKEYLNHINGGCLFFDWCSIQASDNTYIKMNGRGKPLSAFDNFKNTLYAELDKLRKTATESERDFLKDYEVKMDGVWTDLFWQNRILISDKPECFDIAPYMMNFLYYIFEFRHAVHSNSFFFGGKESFRWIDEKNVVTFLVKFKDLCDSDNTGKKGQITIDDYIWASKLLDVLSSRLQNSDIDIGFSNENYSDEIQLIKELSSHQGNVGSTRTVIFSSLYFEYLVNASVFDSSGNLVLIDDSCRNQWVELIGRLIKTASFFKARYDALLRDKHILSGYVNEFIPIAFQNNPKGDFLVSSSLFTDDVFGKIKPYFDSSHVYSRLYEEIVKYKLRQSNPAVWTSLIEQAENELPYFDKTVYFLIKLSQNAAGDFDSNEFRKYIDLMKQVVDEKGIINQNSFSAIMLSKADYRISSGEGYSNSWSLCSNASTDSFSWRYFFDVLEGGIADTNQSKVDVLKAALDSIAAEGSIDKAYSAIPKDQNDSSWRSVIIRYPEILDLGSKHRIVHQEGEDWYLIKSEGVIKQVHSNSLYDSINVELYGLYRSSSNVDKICFDTNRIIIDDVKIVRKDGAYIIKDETHEENADYSEALDYLNTLSSTISSLTS